jgi:putative membrane-bound dehydrogenase-like protein
MGRAVAPGGGLIVSLLRILAACLTLALPAGGDAGGTGLRAPEGFAVSEFSDSSLAGDIFRMTLDPKGRVVVSGRGYIRVLVDDDEDGRADRAVDFADGPRDGAMGMLWEGSSLFVTGDGGLRRYRDEDGDGRADGPSEMILPMKTGGEHHAHAILRGPDGWLYVLCGNMTGIDAGYARLPTSPIKDSVAGCVLRLTPDLASCEVVADGFRNPYGMDFNLDGELFTFDSDNERCVSLPWYEPTRFYHVIPGGHYGWLAPQRADWWRQPPEFPDVVPPIATLGRGSPTGVACYRHVQFPEEYRGGMFLLDWTFGRVWFVPLERRGASYAGTPRVFLESTGEDGFAPTDAVVHPATGDLFVSIGGRGTRGAVYRVRHTEGFAKAQAAAPPPLRPAPRSLGWRPDRRAQLLRDAAEGDAPERLRALLGLLRHSSHFDRGELQGAARANWDHPDPTLRRVTADLVASLGDEVAPAIVLEEAFSRPLTTRALATLAMSGRGRGRTGCGALAEDLLRDRRADPEARLAGVRQVQIALGDLGSLRRKGTVWEGYSPRIDPLKDRALVARVLPILRGAFPSGDGTLDRELSRTLAVIEDESEETLAKVAARLGPSASPVEELHDLIVLARLRAPRTPEITGKVADALLSLDAKTRRRGLQRDRHWPLRVAELHAELSRKDPRLNEALVSHPDFGRPDHALFARVEGFDRRRAAEVFASRIEAAEEFPWSADLVGLMQGLPEDRARTLLRRAWEHGGLDEAILPALARHPRPEDRSKFLDGLRSVQPATVLLCLGALESLPPAEDEGIALVRLLRRPTEGADPRALRDRVAARLRRGTGESLGPDSDAWAAWLAKAHPDLAAGLGNAEGVDLGAWKARLAGVDWPGGDPGRGRAVFARAGCSSCHSGSQALGPDLQGVAGRFSRDDLFTAILSPSRDVSARYRTTLIATEDGQVHSGLVVYEAVDGLILQTGASATVRIAGGRIASRRTSDLSLMPAGLLDRSTDRDLADLYAYLRGLSSPGKE